MSHFTGLFKNNKPSKATLLVETGNLTKAHTASGEAVLNELRASNHGLTLSEASARVERYGRNELPRSKPPGLARLFLRQFASPLIYVLMAAAALSLAIQDWSDAGFISTVLLINAIIGTLQEHSAQRSAEALQKLVTTRCRVLREGDTYEINAEYLVPGDIVLLESGARVPADVRLLSCRELEVDESLLTGESIACRKTRIKLVKRIVLWEIGVIWPSPAPWSTEAGAAV